MTALVVNFLLYLAMTTIIWRREKGFSVNVAIFSFFSLIAFIGIMIYDTPYYNWGYYNHMMDHTRNKMSLAPLLYVFCAFLLFFLSISKINSLNITTITPISRWAEKCVFWGLLAYDFYFLFCFRHMIFVSVDYSSAYADGFDMDQFGFLGKYVLTIGQPLSTLQAVFPFYLLSFKRKNCNKQAAILLFFFIIISYVKANLIASRGTIFFCFIDLFLCFLLCRQMFSSKTNKVIIWGSTIVLTIFVSLSLAISSSRFGDSMWFSIASYFGEPFINFPLIFWEPPFFMNGDYFLYQLFKGIKPQTPFWMGYFRTMPGAIYMDFGVIGSLIFFAILAKISQIAIGNVKNKLTCSQLFIYGYIIFSFAFGVFGLNIYDYKSYAIMILIYIFLRTTKKEH